MSLHPTARSGALLACAAVLCAGPVLAHVTLETGTSPVGATYKAVLRVPHGCSGEATTALRVTIPEGMIAVKPMPKPGWTLTTSKGTSKQTYDYYGTPTSEGVREIVWTGKLLDENYDEFVFRSYIAAGLPVGNMMYVPVVQVCGDRQDGWTMIPPPGKTADDVEMPAPGIKLLPGK